MSVIKKIISTNPEKISLEIDNGDLKALNDVLTKFQFVNEEALIRFILFVLLKAEKNTVYIDEGDKKVGLSPAEKLIKQ